MNSYTYEDVRKKAAANGLWDNMSAADRKLTETNPDAGMSLVNYRLDWKNATTADAKALAHAGAENIRKTYGNYSGGSSGNGYYLGEKTYETAAAPSFDQPYATAEQELLTRIAKGSEYRGAYDDLQKQLTDAIVAGTASAYDQNSDPAYSAYAKQYRREGQRAVGDTLGTLAGATAGMPSTAAVTAANQAGQYYAEKLADKMPELETAALNRQNSRQTALLNALNAVRALDDSAYQRYGDQRDHLYDDLDAVLALDALDYGKQQDQLTRYNTDRAFDYNRFLNDRNYNAALNEGEREQRDYEAALALEKAQADKEEQWNKALYAWEYFGDATLLKQVLARN